MTTHLPFSNPSDWDCVKLVAFDVDGTLYNQRPLRLRIARDLILYSISRLNFNVISVLKTYRTIRERLAEEEVNGFNDVLIIEVASKTGYEPEVVRLIVDEWIEKRPLSYLDSCRYPHLLDLFDGLKRKNKTIGILSDYPARAKMDALGLTADYIVSSSDDGVGFLKPHPRGLEFLMAKAGVNAAETVLIGDRIERDGLAAQRMGVKVLIRSNRPIKDWQTFANYNASLFDSLIVV